MAWLECVNGRFSVGDRPTTNPIPTQRSIPEGSGYLLEGLPVEDFEHGSGSALAAIQAEVAVESAAITEVASGVIESTQETIAAGMEAIGGFLES